MLGVEERERVRGRASDAGRSVLEGRSWGSSDDEGDGILERVK